MDRKAGGGYLKGWILWRQPRALIGYVLAAELVAVGLTLERLLLAADSAVYAAKSAGRNRVVARSA